MGIGSGLNGWALGHGDEGGQTEAGSPGAGAAVGAAGAREPRPDGLSRRTCATGAGASACRWLRCCTASRPTGSSSRRVAPRRRRVPVPLAPYGAFPCAAGAFPTARSAFRWVRRTCRPEARLARDSALAGQGVVTCSDSGDGRFFVCVVWLVFSLRIPVWLTSRSGQRAPRTGANRIVQKTRLAHKCGNVGLW